MKLKIPARRVNLSLDDQLYRAVENDAKTKGIPISTLIVDHLKDLYPEVMAPDVEEFLGALYQEALKMEADKPFILAELPSFKKLVVATTQKEHISPATLRARIGRSFNSAVRNGKTPGIERAMTKDGKLKNFGSTAMYIRVRPGKAKKGDK